MEHDDETPFPREPWRRLLQDEADVPPETTDARIRKAAREAPRARLSRWLLPASLAASVLLAVVIVERQYGERDPADVVTEADVRTSAPADSEVDEMRTNPLPRIESNAEHSAPPRVRKQETPPRTVALPDYSHDPVQPGYSRDPAPGAAERDSADARVGGPEREFEESSEVPQELSAQEQKAPERPAAPPAASLRATTLTRPSPEDWYAEIEKLRAAGRAEEADRELERLKAAYPGWLERHLEKEQNR